MPKPDRRDQLIERLQERVVALTTRVASLEDQLDDMDERYTTLCMEIDTLVDEKVDEIASQCEL